MKRLEYKYLISADKIDALREELQYFTYKDKYLQNRQRDYTVRSIYFDTYHLRFYHEKIQGLLLRKKLRIRGYNSGNINSQVILEIKRKWENYIWKNRAPILLKDVNAFLNSGNFDLILSNTDGFSNAKRDAGYFLHHVLRNNLLPTALIVYDREPLIGSYNSDLRITFDKNLRYKLFPKIEELFTDDPLRLVMKDYFILELKFYNGFPGWLQKIVYKYQLTRKALSKYTICLEAERHLNMAYRRNILAFI